MKPFLVALFILSFCITFAQNNEIIINDSSQYGFNRPRITILNNNIPFVLWGNPSNAKVYGAKLNGSSFSSPVQIVPDSMTPRVGSADGPNLVSYNDSIYVVWSNESPNNHHVFLNKSTDGGATFGNAIQTDTITLGDNLEYPGISINNNGTLGIYFIRSDMNFNNPTQSLIKSTNSGYTFSRDSIVNTFAPGQTCECCQGTMEMENNNWVYNYRNNDANIRNAYSLVSKDNGSTFNDVYELDDIDWTINSCPSSGPEGHLSANNSFTAWMSRGNGKYRILYATVDIDLNTTSTANYIDNFVAPNVNQNYPSVDGKNDTIAVVWQDNRYLFSHIFTAISIDGGSSFLGTILLSDTSGTNGFYYPDVAFSNGIFHYVWKTNNKVIYKSTTLAKLLSIKSINQTQNKVSIYPNPSSYNLTLKTDVKPLSITVLDLTGKLITSFPYTSTQLNIENLSSGVYFLKVTDKENTIIQKFVKCLVLK